MPTAFHISVLYMLVHDVRHVYLCASMMKYSLLVWDTTQPLGMIVSRVLGYDVRRLFIRYVVDEQVEFSADVPSESGTALLLFV